eukprot:scaffold27_cov355-Prasinococcus_capsulatus_cf.AAC.16
MQCRAGVGEPRTGVFEHGDALHEALAGGPHDGGAALVVLPVEALGPLGRQDQLADVLQHLIQRALLVRRRRQDEAPRARHASPALERAAARARARARARVSAAAAPKQIPVVRETPPLVRHHQTAVSFSFEMAVKNCSRALSRPMPAAGGRLARARRQVRRARTAAAALRTSERPPRGAMRVPPCGRTEDGEKGRERSHPPRRCLTGDRLPARERCGAACGGGGGAGRERLG